MILHWSILLKSVPSWRCNSVLGCLSIMCEALDLLPSTTKNKHAR
jgi:hypothetical protein